jgi:hypothetical protein
MDQAAHTIADRYQLKLTVSWQRWFDWVGEGNFASLLPGAFQMPMLPVELAQDRPQDIWPGFMLPDTLPILGNEYGDWICVRVGADNSLGELIHWYHGGGDWIPVGSTIEEAILHDIVDQFRPVRQQMLRGAAETLSPNHLSLVASHFADRRLQVWLSEGLPGKPTTNASAVEAIFERLQAGEHELALEILMANQWAYEATACDLVEVALREAADPKLAQRAQATIAAVCSSLTERRKDLSWPFDVLGMKYQRDGESDAAIETYFAGRHASAFTSQAVRLSNHGFDGRFGKFSIAKLSGLLDSKPTLNTDDYLRAFWQAEPSQLFASVQAYWTSVGRSLMDAADYATAYQAFFAAGWDLGMDRLDGFREIFNDLKSAAKAAGWTARQEVANTHANCLEARLGRKPSS